MNKKQLSGQTVLITVLVLTIAMTVALSLMRRTTADIKTTGQLEESARAFSAAEAGIEDVLKRAEGTTSIIQSGNGSASFETTYTNVGGSGEPFTYFTSTETGDVATIWLVGHNADNSLNMSGADRYCAAAGVCTIDVCWDQPTSPTTKPAVEIAVLYQTGVTYAIDRHTLDPDTVRTGNNFDPLPPTDRIVRAATTLGAGCGKASVYKTTVTLPASPISLRLRPYYNQTTFTVGSELSTGSGRSLPSQGYEVSSTGKTGSGVTRKIVVKKKYDTPAAMFDFVLYASETITHDAYTP